MKQKYRSETVRKGEPFGHLMSVEKVKWFINSNKIDETWQIDDSISFTFDGEFKKQLPLNRVFQGHTGDLGIFHKENGKWTLKVLIEIGGDIQFWYMHPITNKPTKEYPTKHSKKLQQKNDKIIKNWCEKNNVRYITLKKEEILGDCKVDKEYWLTGLRHLQENKELLQWLKK